MAGMVEKKMRTCIGCGRQFQKHELHRIVKGKDGRARYDKSGKAPGRGAYVCSMECLAKACEKSKVSRALRAKVGNDEVSEITSQLGEALEGVGAR